MVDAAAPLEAQPLRDHLRADQIDRAGHSDVVVAEDADRREPGAGVEHFEPGAKGINDWQGSGTASGAALYRTAVNRVVPIGAAAIRLLQTCATIGGRKHV